MIKWVLRLHCKTLWRNRKINSRSSSNSSILIRSFYLYITLLILQMILACRVLWLIKKMNSLHLLSKQSSIRLIYLPYRLIVKKMLELQQLHRLFNLLRIKITWPILIDLLNTIHLKAMIIPAALMLIKMKCGYKLHISRNK